MAFKHECAVSMLDFKVKKLKKKVFENKYLFIYFNRILYLNCGSQFYLSLALRLPVITASLRVMDIVMNSRRPSVAIFSQ